MGTMEDLCEASLGGAAAEKPERQQEPPLPPRPARPMYAGRAWLQGFDPAGQPLVSGCAGFPGEIVAVRSTVALQRDAIGAEVLLLWEPEPAATPVIVGIIQPLSAQPAEFEAPPEPLSIRADAREYVISAEREIVLQCGEASITLTRAGKVIIKGNYVVSRSSGYNKIKGAAVDIN